MIFAIVGPTGSGKSDLAIEVARACSGSIISCDSVQVYKGFNIGSGKVTDEEMNGIPHYLLDLKNGNEEFTVGEFVARAQSAIDEILKQKRVPIIVGGTGLYYRAFAYQYTFNDGCKKKEDKLRKEFLEILEEKGVVYLYEQLKLVDSISAKTINPNHSSRIIRALVYYYIHQDGIKIQEDATKGLRDDILGIYLDVDREILYDRINKRVDKMIESGLVEEVQKLLGSGIKEDSSPMKTIGYKEIISYLKGDFNLDRAIELIKQSSRRYAKRQITWFKRHEELIRLPYNNRNDKEKIIYYFLNYLKKID
ncbi:MAG: tRNA (adenosine(37)-N6)-dimethylallyltransferase MiaA [Firmicutes bacterium]|nr:tRNA (adenosine(37)-N6)-dimethylallyltransferase MiaA [Bacillota bacterium]